MPVFRVLTVHWRSEAWIDPQLRFLERFLPHDFVVYAALEGIDERRFGLYHFAEDLVGTHPEKLDQLAAVAIDDADDDDVLLFVDGDAFPIAPLVPEMLGEFPLVAVRRDEDLGECYPHPCFCLTTAGFWRDLGSTWKPGPIVRNSLGQPITDVGCALLRDLDARDVVWRPLLRSNVVDLHPLWFGVYGDVAYHHGAGFRSAHSGRAEHVDAEGKRTINPRVAARMTRTPSWVPGLYRAERSVRYRAAARRGARFLESDRARDIEALSDEVYASICTDPDFFLRFTRQ
jgi:hypothetical protein